ncbi:ribonuclease D [Reinekea sp. G2M2-21]|uniref:ribonuclease D n=1 Tax=Reinekea sp. G2M2-21 TaxID=2788942 RepID=UPI0018AA8A59|nr:ribonuclease D [Reinekea sp. G2M2-21]
MNSTDSYVWIKNDADLNAVCQLWATASVIALDTEFVRTDTFHANLGLLQICHEQTTWLIDPLEIHDWRPFAAILAEPAIVKVLHSLSEDAEVLLHSVGVTMDNVFDTQIAAGFLGYPVQMSYAKLVEALFDVVLPKEATRSDWLKRPLEDEQCQYAAADVHWLYQIYQLFAEQLHLQSRYEWVAEDSQRMVMNNMPTDAECYYQKLRGAWKLKGARLQALKALCQWREGIARSSNVNRGRILNDKDLIVIAERMPKNKSDLQKYLKIPSRKIRLYGDQIIHMVKDAEEVKRVDWPERIEGPLPADQADLLKQVRQKVEIIAEQLGLPAEVMARRKGLETWLRSGSHTGQYAIPEALTGWRKDFLLGPINELLQAQWEELDET